MLNGISVKIIRQNIFLFLHDKHQMVYSPGVVYMKYVNKHNNNLERTFTYFVFYEFYICIYICSQTAWKTSHKMCGEENGLLPVITTVDIANKLLMTIQGTQSIQQGYNGYNFIPVSCVHVCNFHSCSIFLLFSC